MSKSQRTQKWVSLMLAIVLMVSFMQPFSVAMGSELGTEPQVLSSENASEVAEPLAGDGPLVRGVAAPGPVDYAKGDSWGGDHDDDDDNTLTIVKVVKDHSGATVHSYRSFNITVTGPHGYHKSTTVSNYSSRRLDDLRDGTYTVTEQGASDYTVVVSGTATFDRHNDRRTITITNTEKALGELTVCKTVKDANGNVIDTPRSFTFTLTGPSYPSGEEMTITSGTPLVISGLIYGDYAVTEHDSDYSTVVSGSQCLSIGDKQGRINITNTELPLGQLTISKTVKDANGTIINTPRVFHITLTGPSYPEGSDPMMLTSGTPMVLSGLIYGTYTVTEQDGTDYSVVVSGDAKLSIVDKAGMITITNTELPLGELTITKIVKDADGNVIAIPRTFTIVVTGPSYPNGSAVLMITSGTPLVLRGLIYGTYAISELDGTDYLVAVAGDTILNIEDKVGSLTITNTEGPNFGFGSGSGSGSGFTPVGAKPAMVIAGSVETGDEGFALGWIAILMLGLSTTGAILWNSRRNKGHALS